jgi:hypothetical protein
VLPPEAVKVVPGQHLDCRLGSGGGGEAGHSVCKCRVDVLRVKTLVASYAQFLCMHHEFMTHLAPPRPVIGAWCADMASLSACSVCDARQAEEILSIDHSACKPTDVAGARAGAYLEGEHGQFEVDVVQERICKAHTV